MMAFLGLTICTMMRYGMSLTLTFIAGKKKGPSASHECPVTKGILGGEIVTPLFKWDGIVQAKILAGFFWGYIVTQFPGCIITNLIGPRIVVFWSALLTSLVTISIGPVTNWAGWLGLVVLRVLKGLFQGAFYAALHSVVTVWVPISERGKLGTFVFIGAHAGNIGSVTVTGFLLRVIGQKRWYWLYYFYGGFGIVWSLVFWLMTYDNHTKCPEGLLKEKEKELLDEYYAITQRKKKIKFTEMPWSQIATNLPVYALTIAIWGHCWCLYILVNNIPIYVGTILNFDVSSNGLYLGLCYFSMLTIAIASGFLVDLLIDKKIISVTWTRVLFMTMGSLFPSLGLLGLVYCNCNGTCAFACLIVGMGSMGAFYPSLKINGIDLSPNFGGTVGSVSHWLGTTAGAFGPLFVAIMTPNDKISEYTTVMWVSFILMSATNVFYFLFASGNIQTFNNYKPKAVQEGKK